MRLWRCLTGHSYRDAEVDRIKHASEGETAQLKAEIQRQTRAVDAMVHMLLEDRRRGD